MTQKDEKMLMFKIAERADDLGLLMFDRISLLLDLELVHEKIGLKIKELYGADDANFAHDIIGIQNNVNRAEKTFNDLFLPRYAK